MTQNKSVQPSEGPPSRRSKWASVWDAMIEQHDPVEPGDEGGWCKYECENEKEVRNLQSALHQRTWREKAGWKIETQIDGKTIFFRRVFRPEDVE